MKLRFIILTLFVLFLFTKCTKDKSIERNCNEIEWTGFFSPTDTNCLIPLGTDNFWIYDDSVRIANDAFLTFQTNNYILKIQKFSVVGGNKSYKFNQWFGQLTTRNDTVFTTEFIADLSEPECYKLRPFFMKVTQQTYLNPDRTISIYPKTGYIQTKIGNLSYNFVYDEGGALKYYINDKIGVIRIEILVDNKIKRCQTLNNYKLK